MPLAKFGKAPPPRARGQSGPCAHSLSQDVRPQPPPPRLGARGASTQPHAPLSSTFPRQPARPGRQKRGSLSFSRARTHPSPPTPAPCPTRLHHVQAHLWPGLGRRRRRRQFDDQDGGRDPETGRGERAEWGGRGAWGRACARACGGSCAPRGRRGEGRRAMTRGPVREACVCGARVRARPPPPPPPPLPCAPRCQGKRRDMLGRRPFPSAFPLTFLHPSIPFHHCRPRSSSSSGGPCWRRRSCRSWRRPRSRRS